ncbi:hypothetical protein Aduo_012829 [Ancylostoma duodenale]
MLKTAEILLSKAREALDEAVASSQQIFTQLPSAIDNDSRQLTEWRRVAQARRTRVEASTEMVENAIEKLEAAFQGMDAEYQEQEQKDTKTTSKPPTMQPWKQKFCAQDSKKPRPKSTS